MSSLLQPLACRFPPFSVGIAAHFFPELKRPCCRQVYKVRGRSSLRPANLPLVPRQTPYSLVIYPKRPDHWFPSSPQPGRPSLNAQHTPAILVLGSNSVPAYPLTCVPLFLSRLAVFHGVVGRINYVSRFLSRQHLIRRAPLHSYSEVTLRLAYPSTCVPHLPSPHRSRMLYMVDTLPLSPPSRDRSSFRKRYAARYFASEEERFQFWVISSLHMDR